MGLGPITIFDKSTLQSLNPDEACWFNHFYLANITPLFYVETLADLKKEMLGGRTPEEVVGNLAYKTPASGTPNANHVDLYLSSLFGQEVQFRRIHVPGGRRVIHGTQTGVIFEKLPELLAFERWQAGKFLDIEYEFASEWRLRLSRLNLEEAKTALNSLIGDYRQPNTLPEAKALAARLVSGEKNRFRLLKVAFAILNVPRHLCDQIFDRWKAAGGLPLPVFAPYAAHVLTVDLFFYIAVSAGLISTGDPKNKIDTAYLYYLPFCTVFVSTDKLHRKIVPLFMESDQAFVWGEDLKADLQRLDTHYSQLTDETKAQGIVRFASYPPKENEFLTTRLWDQFLPVWRKHAETPVQQSPEQDAKLVARIKALTEEATDSPITDHSETDYMTIEHRIPLTMGKWRILPPEVEK